MAGVGGRYVTQFATPWSGDGWSHGAGRFASAVLHAPVARAYALAEVLAHADERYVVTAGVMDDGDAIVDVNMNVNQSWRHNHLPRIENLTGFGFRDLSGDACNSALTDCDIGFRREIPRWVDYMTAADQQIVCLRIASLCSEYGPRFLIQFADERQQENGTTQKPPPV